MDDFIDIKKKQLKGEDGTKVISVRLNPSGSLTPLYTNGNTFRCSI